MAAFASFLLHLEYAFLDLPHPESAEGRTDAV
jgi:hypothetical protein